MSDDDRGEQTSVTPLEPIPETADAINELDPYADVPDLLASLTGLGARAQRLVPDLVGVSLAQLDHGLTLTLTLVATEEDFRLLDAIQCLAASARVEGVHSDEAREQDEGDILDEAHWQECAEATAARAVRSTLTLPIVESGGVVGTVNLYAASRRAFVDQHDDLADVFGAWAEGAVTNADLSFATRAQARGAPQVLRDSALVEVAIGILADQLEVEVSTARDRLVDAALVAGVADVELAREVIQARDRRDGAGS